MGTETWQVATSAADLYESQLVPAIFAPWAPRLVAAAGVRAGDRVLDVACGTGIVARAAAATTGPAGTVTGLDLNPGMVAAGRRLHPALTWVEGDAAALPFAAAAFDRVLCQFGLMYVPDRVMALREMGRVVPPTGAMGIAVWAGIEHSPAFARLSELFERHVGARAGELLRAPFVFDDRDAVRELATGAGLRVRWAATETGTVHFPSVDAFVRAEVEGSPAAGLVAEQGEQAYQRLLAAARAALPQYGEGPGYSFPIAAHLVVAQPA